jgi:hypothetical protein
MDLSKLTPYRRPIRPSFPDSSDRYVDQELDRIAVVTSNIIQAIQDLDARLTAAGIA